jgi:hypothetical protein
LIWLAAQTGRWAVTDDTPHAARDSHDEGLAVTLC